MSFAGKRLSLANWDQSIFRLCRRLSLLLRALDPPHDMGAMDQRRTAAKEYSVSTQREAKQMEGDPAKSLFAPRPIPINRTRRPA